MFMTMSLNQRSRVITLWSSIINKKGYKKIGFSGKNIYFLIGVTAPIRGFVGNSQVTYTFKLVYSSQSDTKMYNNRRNLNKSKV